MRKFRSFAFFGVLVVLVTQGPANGLDKSPVRLAQKKEPSSTPVPRPSGTPGPDRSGREQGEVPDNVDIDGDRGRPPTSPPPPDPRCEKLTPQQKQETDGCH